MICYHLLPFQVLGIHAGVQSVHGQAEMGIKYPASQEDGPAALFHDWRSNHKTVCLLHSGGAENLLFWEEFLSKPENPYPWASFCEDRSCLLEMITNVTLVLPEHMALYKGIIGSTLSILDGEIKVKDVFDTWAGSHGLGAVADDIEPGSSAPYTINKIDVMSCSKQSFVFTVSRDNNGILSITDLDLTVESAGKKARNHFTAFDLELARRIAPARLAY
ncbi:hypothetical protein RYA05_05945 [Pseudomonas syringae pv. actinidiae]|nr:hypothetical protein [Pseudomonas syringae pv. actinidiae]